MKTAIACLLILAGAAWAKTENQSRPIFQNVVVQKGDTLWGISHAYLKNPTEWDQILKYNPSLSSDPTAALPGMILRVPVLLLKESKRAAYLIEKVNEVSYRRLETAEWKTALLSMAVYPGDYMRTLEQASARVRFLDASLLSLGPDSLVMIKPLNAAFDARLEKGDVFVSTVRMITPSARITPKTKDTEYSAKVDEILNTMVEVYAGVAAVEAQGVSIDVKAGMSTFVRNGLAPESPVRVLDMDSLKDGSARLHGLPPRALVSAGSQGSAGAVAAAGNASAAGLGGGAGIEDLSVDIKNLSVGIPILGYRIQASKTPDFAKVLFDRQFDVDEKIDLTAVLPAGSYWWRVSLIDLLGMEEAFSKPKSYSVGVDRGHQKADLATAIVILSPSADGEKVFSPNFKVSGQVKLYDLTVSVNGHTARQDEDGNFTASVELSPGPNDITVTVADGQGTSRDIVRTVIYALPAQ